MPAILVTYLGPTNHRGARVKARTSSGLEAPASLTLPYDHTLNLWGNYAKAVKALAAKLNWHGDWVAANFDGGCIFVSDDPGHSAYAFET